VPKRRGGFFDQQERPEDTRARQSDLAAVLTTRRTFPQDIAVDLIEPNPFQARVSFTDIEELAEAMRQHGFTSRLRVRPHPTLPRTFQLLYGERRLRAAQLAGLNVVPCDVADHTDDELIEIGLAENIQRQDLHPLEEARAFQIFIDQRGYSIRRLAERLGKDKSYIEDRLALLRTPQDVQEMVAQRPDTLRAAREIAKLDSPAVRQPLIEGVLTGEITATALRERGRETAATATQNKPNLTHNAQQTVERDARTLRTILARWAKLAPEGPSQRALISEQTKALLREVQRLVEQLEQ
jgi:ParB family chromosome partitioning protein